MADEQALIFQPVMNGADMTFVIEQNVPIPDRGGPNGNTTGLLTTMRSLAVGDSFVAPDRNGKRAPASIAAFHLKPKKFVTRKAEGGIRIWRTE